MVQHGDTIFLKRKSSNTNRGSVKPGAFVSLVRFAAKGMSSALPLGATKVMPHDGRKVLSSFNISVSHPEFALFITNAVFPLQASPQTLSRGKISLSITM